MIIKPLITILVLAITLFTCCHQNKDVSKTIGGEAQVRDSSAGDHATIQSFYQLKDFYNSSPELDSLVDQRYDRMSVREQAAQMIMYATSELPAAGLPFSKSEQLYKDQVIGGLLLLKGSKSRFARQVKQLDSLSLQQQSSQLIYSCDCEPTLYHNKLQGVQRVTASNKLLDTVEVQHAANAIATTIRDMGIAINFAPVVDIGLNKEVINSRSFGRSATDIIKKASTFVTTTQLQNVAACLKHFPGHGAVKGDTHTGAVSIDGKLTELETFKTIIAASRPAMVMIGHMNVKNNTQYGTGGMPCSISPAIIQKLLKQELQYAGIVITDAMQMKAILRIPGADWKAVLAGADIVLIPSDPVLLHRKIMEALSGEKELSSQIETSIKKVIRLKICTQGNI